MTVCLFTRNGVVTGPAIPNWHSNNFLNDEDLLMIVMILSMKNYDKAHEIAL